MKSRNKCRAAAALMILLLLTGCAASGPAADADLPVSPPAAETTTKPERPVVVKPALRLPQEALPPAPPTTVATLAVCGDIMSHLPVTNDAWNGETYDYVRIMADAAPYVLAADYAVGNLETTLAGGPNYTGYPCFNAPDELAMGLKEIGFDLLMTCNNHSLDKGFSGLCRTLDVLDGLGLAHVGTSRTEEEERSNVVLADVGGLRIAFLAYTYGTNGIPMSSKAPWSVNLFNKDYLTHISDLDEERILEDIAQAKEMRPDMVAVMIHWGVEYQTKQNRYQNRIADFLIENGVDLVLGGHSHVPQPIEMRTVTLEDGTERTGFVIFSLGNFISSQNDPLTDTTAVVTVEITRDNYTGVVAVTGWNYAPMLMLDREWGTNRFELLDANLVLGEEGWSDFVLGKARKVIDDCAAILGPAEVILP